MMTSRRPPDGDQQSRELLRSSQLQRIANLMEMLELSPVGYSDQESWDRYCERLGLQKYSYPEGTYITAYKSFPGLGILLYIPMGDLQTWIAENVPMSPKERELFLAQQTLKLMEP